MVAEAGPQDRLDVGDPAGRPDPVGLAEPGQVVPGHHVGVEADAGHQGEPTPAGLSQVQPQEPARGDRLGHRPGPRGHAEVPGEEVLGPGGQDRHRHPGPLVEQGRDRPVPADGHQAAAARRSGSAAARGPPDGVQPTFGSSPSPAQLLGQPTDPAPTGPDPGVGVGHQADPGRPAPSRDADGVADPGGSGGAVLDHARRRLHAAVGPRRHRGPARSGPRSFAGRRRSFNANSYRTIRQESAGGGRSGATRRPTRGQSAGSGAAAAGSRWPTRSRSSWFSASRVWKRSRSESKRSRPSATDRPRSSFSALVAAICVWSRAISASRRAPSASFCWFRARASFRRNSTRERCVLQQADAVVEVLEADPAGRQHGIGGGALGDDLLVDVEGLELLLAEILLLVDDPLLGGDDRLAVVAVELGDHRQQVDRRPDQQGDQDLIALSRRWTSGPLREGRPAVPTPLAGPGPSSRSATGCGTPARAVASGRNARL